MEQTYAITGMRCQGCARKLETALAVYGQSVEIDFPAALVRMVNPTATLEELNGRLAEVGAYTLSPKTTVQVQQVSDGLAEAAPQGLVKYYPLLLIAGYLTLGSFANAATADDWMRHFMAGFFLIFSFFKLLSIRAFANSYKMYDLIAARWRGYGLVYPFLELALGLAYLFAWQMQPVLWVTLALTLISGFGVVRSMMRRQTIRCACLGAVLNVPVSTVTLVEDFGMAAMAVAMLAM